MMRRQLLKSPNSLTTNEKDQSETETVLTVLTNAWFTWKGFKIANRETFKPERHIATSHMMATC